MRAAPPVEVIAALRGGWWVAACGLWLSGLGCFAGWLMWHLSGEGTMGTSSELPLMLPISLLGIGTLAAAGTLLWHARQEPMRLSWNGSHWVCEPLAATVAHSHCVECAGGVDLMLDLGDAMLLRWRALTPAARRVIWLPVSKTAARGDAWHGLRVALSLPTPAATPGRGAAT